MPGEWKTVKLADVADVNPENISTSGDGSQLFSYIDISSVDAGVINWAGLARFSRKDAPSRARRAVRHGDFLLCNVRPLLGAHAIIGKQDSPHQLIASTGFSVIRGTPKFSTQLFRHLAFSPIITDQIRAREVGSSYPAITEKDVAELRLTLPPLSQQRRIAAILDTLDHTIEGTQRVIEKLQATRQGLLHDLLTRGLDERGHLRDPERSPELFNETKLGWLPREWSVDGLASRALEGMPHVRTGPFGTALKSEHWTEQGTPVITIGALGEGDFIQGELLFVSPDTAKRLQAYQVEPGNLVFSRVADVGRSVVVGSDESGWLISSNLMRLSLDAAKVDPYYFQVTLSSSRTVRSQIRRAVNAGGREVANTAVLNSLLFPWPSLGEQQRIVAVLEGHNARLRNEKTNLAKLQVLKRGLMNDLLTGRVRVPTIGAEEGA